MIEILIKILYTSVLLAIEGICLREAWQVWYDDTLQYGQFAATKDGADVAATGDSFRRLIVQQQAVLYRLFKGGRSRAGEFNFRGDELQISALSELGDIPASLLDKLKIEAAGVNVSSMLSTLRRVIKPPNEISGSIDEFNGKFYVSAQWPSAPHRGGNGTESRTFALQPQANLDVASFDLACRIFLARVAPSHPAFRAADEDDFCAFARALFDFRRYVVARDQALDDAGKNEARERLKTIQASLDRLMAAKTELPYAYKLGAYIDIERLAAIAADNSVEIKRALDLAEQHFGEYITQLAKLDPKAEDADVQERLVYLATRRGKLDRPQEVAESVNVKQFLKVVAPALGSLKGAQQEQAGAGGAAGPGPLRPGVSIGGASAKNAVTSCCFVKDEDGKTYLVTVAHVVDGGAGEIVSPATIDGAQHSQRIGVMDKVLEGVGLVAISPGVRVDNGDIAGMAPDVQPGDSVRLLGRTSQRREGKVTGVEFNVAIQSTVGEGFPSSGLILTDRISLPGDGGAPVLDSQNRLVGMLIAGSIQASIVLPLKPIFERYKLTLL